MRPADLASGSAPDPRGPRILACITVATTVLLIGLGGMVTSTGSGMAFRDWPLADGSLWPARMGLDGLLEHSHRALGALVGLMGLSLTIWVGVTEKRAWLRRLTVAALGLLVVQGILGGLGVLQELPVANSVAHGVIAQLTLCTLGAVAFALSPVWAIRRLPSPESARTARRLCATGVALALVQTTIGGIARHGGDNVALWTHVLFAMVVAVALLIASAYCSGKFQDLPGIRANANWVLGIVLMQLMLGFAALAVRTGKDPGNIHFLGRSALISSHVLVGAILVLASTLLMLRAFRNLDPTAPDPGGRQGR